MIPGGRVRWDKFSWYRRMGVGGRVFVVCLVLGLLSEVFWDGMAPWAVPLMGQVGGTTGGGVSGTGTAYKIPRWTSKVKLGDSLLSEFSAATTVYVRGNLDFIPNSLNDSSRLGAIAGILDVFGAATGAELRGVVRVADGTVGAPSLSFGTDTDTGIFRVGADELGLVTGGSSRIVLGPTNTVTFNRAGNAAWLVTSLPPGGSQGYPIARFVPSDSEAEGGTSGTPIMFEWGGKFNPASGTPTNVAVRIKPTIAWGGTPGAGSTEALRLEVVETALPTGTNWGLRYLAGSAGTTFKYGVTNVPWAVMAEGASNPGTGLLSSLDTFAVYMKADKFVIAYNNAGTITYITIPMDGSTTSWTHGTTAP